MSRKPMASRRQEAPSLMHWLMQDRHAAVVGLLPILAVWLLIALSGDPDGEISRVAIQIDATEARPEAANEALATVPVIEEPAPTEVTQPKYTWTPVTVRSGQSMDRIFKDLGLSASLLHQLINLDDRTKQLVTIKPGDVFYFALDSTGGFEALKGEYDETHWLLIEKNPDESLASTLEARDIEHRIVEATATIDTSLFNAAKEANLSDNMTMKLANVFGWDIDFALDIRKGDRFSLIYEEIWRDGEYHKDGVILAARFVNRGDVFEAVRFDTGDGADYFDPEGRRMRKAFLRAPLNFTRVTSNFNPRRFHPVTQRIRPHNGTDYGAAPGTPVWSAGDGVVIESAYNRVNGHYVFVQHGNHIVTRYLHLSRRDVKRSDRVRQGQTIGTVGSTGLATGPHLHYEFLVNGTHRDPRTVDLPPADPLPAEQRVAFAEHTERWMTRLDRFDQQTRLLASVNNQNCESNSESC